MCWNLHLGTGHYKVDSTKKRAGSTETTLTKTAMKRFQEGKGDNRYFWPERRKPEARKTSTSEEENRTNYLEGRIRKNEAQGGGARNQVSSKRCNREGFARKGRHAATHGKQKISSGQKRRSKLVGKTATTQKGPSAGRGLEVYPK